MKKWNVFSILLLASSIAMAVLFVISVILTFSALDAIVKAAIAQMPEGTGADAELIKTITTTTLVVVYVLAGIVLLFAVLAGLKLSLHNRWFAAAVVFGAIFAVSEIYSAVTAGTSGTAVGPVAWIDFALSLVYFISAIGTRVVRKSNEAI